MFQNVFNVCVCVSVFVKSVCKNQYKLSIFISLLKPNRSDHTGKIDIGQQFANTSFKLLGQFKRANKAHKAVTNHAWEYQDNANETKGGSMQE